MFAKLLKHEWRATRGGIGLLCAIILISGLLVGISLRLLALTDGNEVVMESGSIYIGSEGDMQILEIMCVVLATAGMFAIGFCCVGSIFLLISRFYKRCFTDEGYLTFTLPVNNHQILLSSILNTVLGSVLVVIVAAVGAGIIFALFLSSITQQIIWADVWAAWEGVWQQLWESFVKNAGQFALLGFSAVTGAVSELILLMLAVTIGALIAKKHKILAAVGVYYGIGFVKSVAYTLFAFSATTTRDVSILLAMPGIVGLVLAIGGYFMMHWLTSKKLNLT